MNGDIDIESIYAASLPSIHPSFAPRRHLEMSAQWQAPPLPGGAADLFIGILSAGNHFAERMAVRKSWMSAVRRSSNVVARFFVALVTFSDLFQVLFSSSFMVQILIFFLFFWSAWTKGNEYGIEEGGRVLRGYCYSAFHG